MPFGGKLRLAIDLARLSTAQAAELDLPEGVYARLSVIDEGTGIPEEIRDRIFEPFFTTKEAGKGTGLGLSMVFGTLRQNDGAVAYDTSVGQGSRFFLYLPVVAPDAQAAAPAPTARPSTGSERIWLVEDQPHLRSMIERALRSLGYRVASFPSGDELLAALPDLEPAQVLMTDVVLPGIDGVQLARRVRAILGDIRILVSSGYDADAMRDWHPEPGWRFLAKPFAVGALARALRSVLDQP
jgi:two-component system cell cycle sensor histidine kinase/response regulator CckA